MHWAYVGGGVIECNVGYQCGVVQLEYSLFL